ncbi:prepilin-type N-terminal cleavage/methylation domain-containing protein [Frigoribacterium sp. PhB107]|uniref:prepilin-type N-terminal cleavage/methylation domain-containing protein n=1 Tax=Frigoribacterium sp. PhB107 TaxID=2485172 RepID=UPI000F49DC82|nr:prepilin-type N-terminal cleavage/methylation domain-containing protein [Frigoribacterium sp. PhB107]ROP75405.1 prepilin-type N-terminal cleavage/methylation domain-containing protein [Frigoribacterium sp. PhB107]
MFRRLNDVLRPASPAERDTGFSLVEVIVAMMVFTIISIGVAYTITNSLVLTRESRARAIATQLAAQDIDLLRSVKDVFTIVDKTWTTEVGGTTYEVTRRASWATTTSNTTICGTGTGTLQYKQVEVSVSYAGMRPGGEITSATAIAPNSRINDPNKGTIVVEVLGASGTGTSGVTVQIAAATDSPNGAVAPPTPAKTDSTGCTYALGLAAGNYQVTISKGGAVGPDQKSTQVMTPVVVTAGTSQTASFSFDTAASFNASVGREQALLRTLPTNLDLTFRSSAQGDYTVAASAASPVPLFPFTGGYSVMAGRHIDPTTDPKNNVESSCLNVDPSAWTTPAADGMVGAQIMPVGAAPGDSAVPIVPTGVVQLADLPGVQRVAAVQQNSKANGDPGCVTGQTYYFPSVTALTAMALPYGTWKFYTYNTSNSGTVFTLKDQITPRGDAARTRGIVDTTAKTVLLDPRGGTP